MQGILKLLINGLDAEERESVVRRVEAMESELTYLQEKKPRDVRMAVRKGWSIPKLQVIFCLNSFYQRILAPLVASSIAPSAIGSTIPIRYGTSLRFDTNRILRMTEMEHAFWSLCDNFDIKRFMLEAQHTGDLVWSLAHPRGERNAND